MTLYDKGMRCVAPLAAVLMAGCASGPLYHAPDAPPEGYANVVVYRLPAMQAAAWASDVYVDDKEVAHIRIKGYTSVLVKAGNHEIKTGGQKILLRIEPGQTYYLEYGTFLRSLTWAGSTPIAEGGANYELVSPKDAPSLLTEYHYSAPIVPKVE